MTAPRQGTWAALAIPPFRNFWLLSFLAFMGASVQSVGAGWLVATLAGSPLLVGMVQGVFTLSQFLMALPAGALADLLDRRVVMLGALGTMMTGTLLLGGLTLAGAAAPTVILALTFCFGLGASAMTPAMQATMPDLVPRDLLPSALTLNGLTVSVARAAGPALAGLLLGLWGGGLTLLINVLAFVGLFVVVARWRDPRPRSPAPAGFGTAIAAGVRFAVAAPAVRRLMLKSAASFFGVSILLALLPAVVAERFGGAPETLGLLLGCFGLGSVLASFALGRLYARLSRSRVIDLANVAHGVAVLALAVADQVLALAPAMFVAGLAWTALTTSVGIVAQLVLPAEYRARGLSINMMAMMGALTLGAAAWGQVAEVYGLGTAFAVAGLAGLLMPLVTARLRLAEQPVAATV